MNRYMDQEVVISTVQVVELIFIVVLGAAVVMRWFVSDTARPLTEDEEKEIEREFDIY
jgi:hypothetical protein